MEEKKKVKISKFLSLILRHQPETVGLKLDANGWVKTEDLIKACAEHGRAFTLKELQEIVETNEKKRFAFDKTGDKIRANQGHSLKVKIEFEKRTPPEILYHGTAEKNIDKIFAEGLSKMNRHHVHLTEEIETARSVGIRYGKPVILKVDTKAMIAKGFEFFVSANDVWLVENIPAEFLEKL